MSISNYGSDFKITFDPTDYPYEKIAGEITSGGVDGGPALKGYIVKADIMVDLPGPSTVHTISLAAKGSPAFYWDVFLHNAQDQMIHQFHGFTSGGWHTFTEDELEVEGVVKARFVANTNNTPLGPGTAWLDNCVLEFSPTSYGPSACSNTGGSDCPITHAGESAVHNPVGLRLGEKREQLKDLSLNTPAGELALVRSFRQSKLDDFTVMGLGWIHNHHLPLTFIAGTPNQILVRLPRGGEAYFTETSQDHFEGVAGVGSTIDKNGSDYVLTATDKATYTFDANGRITARTWPSGETWTYTYVSGRLASIDDGYGRQLQFVYYSTADFKDGQLWRVGDHTASGLDGGSPSGRYVEYDYIGEKVDGSLVQDPRALLASVRDVRGQVWTYEYYGQHAGETDTDQLNFLTQRVSPSVDVGGDGTPDGQITLESLAYTTLGATITGLTQQHGIWDSEDPLLEMAFAFQPNGENVTTETTAGKTTTHRFLNGAYAGPEDPAGNYAFQYLSDDYRPYRQQDANGNGTDLLWSSDGKQLRYIADALGNHTLFNYNPNDTLDYTVDAEGRQTVYTYGDTNHPRLPTEIEVFDTDGTTLLRWQRFSYDTKGRVLSEEQLDPADGSGTTVLQRAERSYYGDAAPLGAGLLESMTQKYPGDASRDVITTYLYDTFGRVVQTNRSTTFGSCLKSRTVYDAAGQVVATICNYEPGDPPDHPADAAEAAALYDAQYPDRNHVTTHAYDSLGRRIATTVMAGSPFARTTLTAYDALGRVVRTIANYVADASVPNPFTAARTAFDHGAEDNANLVSDTAYNERGLVRSRTDVLGNVTLFGYDDAGRLVKTIRNASDDDYDNSYGGGDPELADYTPVSDADRDLITEQSYDANGNLVRQVDPLGRVSFTVYDALNRAVKTVRSARDEATVDLESGDEGYEAADDPRSASYEPSDAPDRDLITLTEYDAMGRVVETTDPLEHVSRFGYDALGRQVIAVSNFYDDSLIDTDLTNWEWDANDGRWEDGSGNPIPHGVDNDRNLLSATTYDEHGRVAATRDVLGAETRFTYDGFGRQVLTVSSFYDDGIIDTDLSDWVWDANDDRWEDGSGNPIPHGEADDRNVIQQTVYDDEGFVRLSQDRLGRSALVGYDALGRQVKTVRNASDPGYDTAADPDLSGYTGVNPDPDQDVTGETVYDAEGRVFATVDTRGNETRFAYDSLGRRVLTVSNFYDDSIIDTDLGNWVWDASDGRWEDGSGNPLPHGETNDRNLVAFTAYDLAGRVASTRDAAGIETRFAYDRAGRRVESIFNHVDGVFDPDFPDEDLVAETVHDKAGQVTATLDARGTRTTFGYDAAGRRRTLTRAAGTPLASTDWTCFDKGGRTLRLVRNCTYDPARHPHSPDERDAQGAWLYVPQGHGRFDDRDLVTSYTPDAAGRVTLVTDPLGHATGTTYGPDGRVVARTDALGRITTHVHDGLGRLRRVVQNHVPNGEDPTAWVWDETDGRWEKSDGAPIEHGPDQDQNIVVEVALDLAGRKTGLTDPRGYQTSYTHDRLDRRTGLTDPLAHTWATAYGDLPGGVGTRVELTNPLSQVTRRDSDRLGRLTQLSYLNETPKLTPDVAFGYDLAGNRTRMSEDDGTNPVRETLYAFDATRRLTGVDFDTDGDSQVEQSVAYEYDAGGLRTKLTLPGDLSLTYTYDTRGQLVGLEDWDGQVTRYTYDLAGRLVATERENSFRTRYTYDAGGRLRQLRHARGGRTLGHFAYEVDALGNRTQALEALPQHGTGETTLSSGDPAIDYHRGAWTASGDLMASPDPDAALRVAFFGDEATLTLGVGLDYGICDVYVDGSLWRSFDNYAASAGEDVILLPLQGEGPHILEVRNRSDKNLASTGYKLSFKSLVTESLYDLYTIQYGYDGLSRLTSADYYEGGAANGPASLRGYTYVYDLAGNRIYNRIDQRRDTPSTLISHYAYAYNDANQMVYSVRAATVSDPTPVIYTVTYDNAGRMTSDGTNTYTWDRADRLLSMGGIAYAYDGAGNRVSQTANSILTEYLNDVQPGLTKVLFGAVGNSVTRYVHGPRGIQAVQDGLGVWTFPVQDGLGSVRGEIGMNLAVNGIRHLAPYGDPFGETGTFASPYGFTGEQTDVNRQVYLRERYYNPSIGVFPTLDPVEGNLQQIMALNRYAYAGGNPVNYVDPSGMVYMVPPPTCYDSDFDFAWVTSSGGRVSGPHPGNPGNGYAGQGRFGTTLRNNVSTGGHFGTMNQGQSRPNTCDMQEAEGVAVLAYSAARETGATGSMIREDDHVKAALMIMQVNAFRTPNVAGSVGNWTLIGTSDASVFLSRAVSNSAGATPRERELASLFVAGYCEYCNPLAYFETLADPMIAGAVSREFPDVAAHLHGLSRLARQYGDLQTALKHEVSIHASRMGQFQQEFPSSYPVAPNYPAETPSKQRRAVAIVSQSATRPWIRYQCAIDEVEVMATNPSDLESPYSLGDGDFSCRRCQLSHYWVLNESTGRYEEMTTEAMLAAGRIGYGAKCR